MDRDRDLERTRNVGRGRGQGTRGTEHLVPNDKPPRTPEPAYSHGTWDNTEAGVQA